MDGDDNDVEHGEVVMILAVDVVIKFVVFGPCRRKYWFLIPICLPYSGLKIIVDGRSIQDVDPRSTIA